MLFISIVYLTISTSLHDIIQVVLHKLTNVFVEYTICGTSELGFQMIFGLSNSSDRLVTD